MNLIDSFILAHHDEMTVPEIAYHIGIESKSITMRMKRLLSAKAKTDMYLKPVSLNDEIVGLIKLIEDRQTGWAVDVAKQRLIDLNKLSNRI